MKNINDIQEAIRIPRLTARNAELEPWRIQRLKRIVGKLNSFAYNHYKHDLLKKLVRLHDENDTLQITWESEPSAAERNVTREVWYDISESKEYRVNHIV